MFGAAVAGQVERDYYQATEDVHVTAHLEVPGEMFALALEAGGTRRLRFVLGTEAGMVTAIVRALRERLAAAGEAGREVEIEIIFPVAAEAVSVTEDPSLPLVPGVSGGEGCSTAGGCATCPYMKMNSLDALCDLLERLPEVGADERAAKLEQLAAFEPEKYAESIAGKSVASLGTEPILHMRAFQRGGALPDALISDMRAR